MIGWKDLNQTSFGGKNRGLQAQRRRTGAWLVLFFGTISERTVTGNQITPNATADREDPAYNSGSVT